MPKTMTDQNIEAWEEARDYAKQLLVDAASARFATWYRRDSVTHEVTRRDPVSGLPTHYREVRPTLAEGLAQWLAEVAVPRLP